MVARPALVRLVDSMIDVPAFLFNKRLDILAANALGRALYSPMFANATEPVNTMRFCFLEERTTRTFWADWEGLADAGVAVLRAERAVRPHDRDLARLVNELSERSDEFRTRWATHDVHRHTSGLKAMNHPLVGRLELPYENLLLPSDADLYLMIYNPEPGTAAYDALRLLSLWNGSPFGTAPGRAQASTTRAADVASEGVERPRRPTLRLPPCA